MARRDTKLEEIKKRNGLYQIREYSYNTPWAKKSGEGEQVATHYAVNPTVANTIAKQIEKTGHTVLILTPQPADIMKNRTIIYSTPKHDVYKGNGVTISEVSSGGGCGRGAKIVEKPVRIRYKMRPKRKNIGTPLGAGVYRKGSRQFIPLSQRRFQ